MNVLSLFDGMSCGQIALNKAGVKYDNYFASEIKPHGIKITQHNYSNTIQIGDVTKVYAKDLPKIDLLIGGSPCQSFSSAGKLEGFNGKSGLFWEYVRIYNELKPKYFLLENVNMKAEWKNIISEHLGVEPIRLNSNLLSAQNRDRLYWTNIKFDIPKEKHIKFQDILENGYTDRLKARCLLESESRNPGTTFSSLRRYMILGFINVVFKDKQIYEKYFNMSENEMKENFMDGDIRKLTQTEMERLQTVPEGYTSILKRNEAASLLGDGWTVDVIAHIFSYLD
jgi:site-specific DNA-cytosine methylase